MVRERRQHRFDARRHRALLGIVQIRYLDGDWTALRRQFLGNFINRPSREDGTVVLLDLPRGIFRGVFVLDEQPLVALFAVLHFYKSETAPQLLSIENEFDLA